LATFSNTVKPGLKSHGVVKNALNSNVRRMLAVDSRARGGAKKGAGSGFAETATGTSLSLLVSINVWVVVED
jgi:hypothetical protein